MPEPASLVLLHGWGSTPVVWDDLCDRLPSEWRVIRPGVTGDDTNRILSRLENMVSQPATWLGWSLGALIAMQAALRLPGLVRRLLLVSATPAFVMQEDWDTGIPAQQMHSFQADVNSNPRQTQSRFHALQAKGDVQGRKVIRLLRQASGASADPVDLLPGLEILARTDLRERLADIVQPVSLLHGAADQVVPVGAGRYLADTLQASIEVWDHVGHAPFLSDPERFHGWVLGNME